MEHIELGKSDLVTSRIGLGTWAMGGWMWGGTDEAQSIATIRSAIDRGVTLIDTAPVYGFGRSEEIVGKVLEGSLRHKVTIATKVGLAWKDRAVYRDSRPARIRQEIEDSLRRLRTDVIDLYQVHWPDFETPIAETARTLEDLRPGLKTMPTALPSLRLQMVPALAIMWCSGPFWERASGAESSSKGAS
jgi:aryl-alcohol dehydrogenase-like predicted oxidoreductase